MVHKETVIFTVSLQLPGYQHGRRSLNRPGNGRYGGTSRAHVAPEGRIPPTSAGRRACRAEARRAKAGRGLPTSSPSANLVGRWRSSVGDESFLSQLKRVLVG